MDPNTRDPPTTSFLTVPEHVPQLGASGARGSAESIASLASNASAFSGASELADELDAKKRKEISDLQAKQGALLPKIEEEIKLMLDACAVQRNVSMSIKDGLARLREWCGDLRHIHRKMEKAEKEYQDAIELTRECRRDRKRIRTRIQGETMRAAILAAQAAAPKRTRPPSEEDTTPPDNKRKRPDGGRKKKKEEQEKKKEKKKRKEADAPVNAPAGRAAPQAPKSRSTHGSRHGSRGVRSRPPALVVKLAAGQTYAGVLGKIRKDLPLADTRAEVTRTRPTANGDILIEVTRSSNTDGLSRALETAVGGRGTVRAPQNRVSIEVRNLDSLSTVDEVREALVRVLGPDQQSRKITISQANTRGLKLAVLDLDQEEAARLMEAGRLLVGFTSASLRERTAVLRCYRCLGYGHTRQRCAGVDRSKACFKCGGEGHSHTRCGQAPKCFLCGEAGQTGGSIEHVAGSGKCPAFRRALEAATKPKGRGKKYPPT